MCTLHFALCSPIMEQSDEDKLQATASTKSSSSIHAFDNLTKDQHTSHRWLPCAVTSPVLTLTVLIVLYF